MTIPAPRALAPKKLCDVETPFLAPETGLLFGQQLLRPSTAAEANFLALGLRDALPSAVRSCQALTFYPALAYGVDNNRLSSVNFIGVRNRSPSGIIYRVKVTCGCSEQARQHTRGGQFGKIADLKLHAGTITGSTPLSNDKSSAKCVISPWASMSVPPPSARQRWTPMGAVLRSWQPRCLRLSMKTGW